MQPTTDNTNPLDRYRAILDSLNPADKNDLTARLATSVKAGTMMRRSRSKQVAGVGRIVGNILYINNTTKTYKHVNEINTIIENTIKYYSLENTKIESFAIALADGKTISEIPQALYFLQNAIDDSRFILDLPDNWDDCGSEAYTAAVWNSAITFLVTYATHIWTAHKRKISAPQIFPGPKGSIDMLWDNEAYRALVNISKDAQKGTFFVDKLGNQSTEGTFFSDNFDINMLPILD